jgi:hypothetical protein
MMNKNQGLKAVAEIESLIKGFGSPDSQARRCVKSLVSALRHSSNDDYFTEKLGNLEEWANVGFSTKKFLKYSGGADQVRDFARADCTVLKRLIRKWAD